ncbi:MAG: hypothetical protein LBB85_02675 [Dysgonamonadaceae bacterium]|jgi:C-terminal processing protease CtpA/Prc|nr:hypothetical protein [Dysgonamonadaceae bacterium]
MQNFIFKKLRLLWLFSIVLIIGACEGEDPESLSQETQTNKYINDWIQEYMDVLYLWNNRMPVKTDKTLSPDNYFNSLLYTEEDHFSYIAANYAELSDALNGVQMEAGYAFSLFFADQQEQDVVGLIDYIKPHSPASSSGLRRGDLFLTINGKSMTIHNIQELTAAMSAPHTLGIYRNNAIQDLSLTVARYEENPVLLDSIYNVGGKKIAYLIFNFFSTDNGDNSYTYLKELNEIFGKYKQTPVDELILDLRYNGGGSVSVATSLASMISNRTSSDLFSIDQYNSIVDMELKAELGNDYNKTFFDDFLIIRDADGYVIDSKTPINKLGLQRLYVLVSQGTASASELVINGLKPYMEVILIGQKTYGKNVGMWFIYEQDPQKQQENRWGMLPVVVKTYNANNQSDYNYGFTPDIEANEYAEALAPLGDTREILLEKALDRIGVQPARSFRNDENGFLAPPFLSSIDRTPGRKNLIIPVIRSSSH